MMDNWLHLLSSQAEATVLITIIESRGSAPREAGAKMIVTQHAAQGTIGGGQLEYRSIEVARNFLQAGTTDEGKLQRFPLGASLGQCCGGVVTVLFERINPGKKNWIASLVALRKRREAAVIVTSLGTMHRADRNSVENPDDAFCLNKLIVTEDDHLGQINNAAQLTVALTAARDMLLSKSPCQPEVKLSLFFEPIDNPALEIVIFGAGHVGQSLVRVLGDVSCQISLIDNRADQIPTDLPPNTTALVSDEPEFEIDRVSSGAMILVMTHSHALDQRICERALRRDAFSYCGLIGSSSKRNQFHRRLRGRGLSDATLGKLICPIGLSGITDKHPAQIAISVAAQVLQLHAGQVANDGELAEQALIASLVVPGAKIQ